jgi:hypothetical protein
MDVGAKADLLARGAAGPVVVHVGRFMYGSIGATYEPTEGATREPVEGA